MAINDKLIKEIRDEYSYFQAEWRDVHVEGKKDMRYVAGDPWEPQEKQARKDANRPCFALDELSQYVNQLINDPRQNKRAIKVNPKGDGADDKTAELRANIIREIEYNSRAQAAYTTGFQGSVERSYGYWRVGSRYVQQSFKPDSPADESQFEQELYIGRIPNPDTVMFHPNFKEMDASDSMACFVTDRMRRDDFKRKYPWAEITDFTPEMVTIAPQWLDAREVTVAEYWKIKVTSKKLFLVDTKEGPIAMFQDELPKDFDKSRIMRERKIDKRSVIQYITNGVEILDETEIPISIIPIVPVFGKEIYVDEGAGARRKLLSLIRLARDPYMLYCYYRSCEAEVVGMTPKTPWIGAVGQFETHKEQWQNVNKIPYAYLQYDPVLDSMNQPLPPPQRQSYEPAIQPLEIGAEAARRAIQAAMGINALPTPAQRQNEKSGVALQQIESQEDRGSFHFIDNYNFAIEKTARILNEWIPSVYDTPRDIGVRLDDETHKSIRINDPDFEEPDKDGQPVKQHYDTTTGEHGVTVSVGPSFESQRAEADDFVNTLVGNIEAIAQLLPPGVAAKLISLSIKLKQLGPIGDSMANEISPPPDQAAQQQQIAQGAQALQQSQQMIQEMQAELGKLKLEKAGKVIDNEYAMQLAQINNDVKVLIAEVNTQQQNVQQRMEMFMQYWTETHGAAHEAGMQAADQAHEKAQTAVAGQQASQQSAQDAAQQQAAQLTAPSGGNQ